MANRIERPQPPALPQAPGAYQIQYVNQFNSVLRLFFRRLTSTLDELLSVADGGRYLYMPRGLFYSTTDQTAAATSTGYPVEFENTYIGSGVSIVGGTRATVTSAGVYNFQVTLTTQHTNAASVTVWAWINKDGTDIPYGAQKQTVKGNGDQAMYWNFSIDLLEGQYIEMYWATDDTDLSLHTETATSLHSGIPSAVVAVSFVSNL
jgi:hypothetical protein